MLVTHSARRGRDTDAVRRRGRCRRRSDPAVAFGGLIRATSRRVAKSTTVNR